MAQASRQRSITPSTFKGATPIAHNIPLIQHEHAEVGNLISREESSKAVYQTSVASTATALRTATGQVTDQGKSMEAETKIDALVKLVTSEFDSRIDRYTKYQEEFRLYLDFLSKYPAINLSTREHYSYENKHGLTQNEVTRFGIDTSGLSGTALAELSAIYVPNTPSGSVKTGGSKGSASSGGSKKQNLEQHMLHPLEVLNIRAAIEFCQTSAKKTVLVDIFARDEKTGSIKLEASGAPEIHTIVLYLQQDGGREQLLVIDPSNSEFSKHLAVNADLIFMPHSGIPLREVLVPPTKVQIYSPPSGVDTGPNPDDLRDCTDVAVKLAFGLNKHAGIIDMKNLASLSAIQQIGNNESVNKSLFFEPVEVTARIRQASSDDLREGVDEILASMKAQIKSVEVHFKDDVKREEFETKNKAAFSALASSDQYKALAEGILRDYNDNEALYQRYMNEVDAQLEVECAGLFTDL